MNRLLISLKNCSSYFLPVITSTNSLRSEEALMASLAPLRTIQLCFSSKAESQALQRMSDMLAAMSRIPSKVTLMNVRSHIRRSRFLPVESQCLYSLGALRSLLLPPLYCTMLSCISMRMKLRKPACPLKRSLFSVMTLTLSLTSEKAMPRKVLMSLKALQNWCMIWKNSSKGISLVSWYLLSRFPACWITYSTSNPFSSFSILLINQKY